MNDSDLTVDPASEDVTGAHSAVALLEESESDGEASATGEKAEKPQKSLLRTVIEWVAILVVSVLVAIVIRSYFVQTFYIPSGSMEPTLQVGDRIFVDKLAYHLRPIHRGDIVVFHRPPLENCPGAPVADLVKRVVGLPGDHLSSKGNKITVNGKLLVEPYLPKDDPLIVPVPSITVPAGEYFMMGDNRGNSCDSRDWGTLPRQYIVGDVFFRIWPLTRIGFPA